MVKHKYEKGELVELKSGGPTMTIESLSMSGAPRYLCQWFAGKKLYDGHFPEESLILAKKDDEKKPG